MPIRINLLAEAQALEDARRRDPVKRVILAGVFAIVLILVWSSSLMVRTMIGKGELSQLEGSLNSRTNAYRQILENQFPGISVLSHGEIPAGAKVIALGNFGGNN